MSIIAIPMCHLTSQNHKNARRESEAWPVGTAAKLAGEKSGDRNAYYGETNVHTSWSFDACVFGNTQAGPQDAYKYAMGQPVEHLGGYK